MTNHPNRSRRPRPVYGPAAYTETIKKALADTINPNLDPRWVEASMRIQFGTLEHLLFCDFESEAAIAVCMHQEMGDDFMEKIARSFGL